MRKCDNCGKALPTGSNIIMVVSLGFDQEGEDFCSPLCFAKYYSSRGYRLKKEAKKKEVKK